MAFLDENGVGQLWAAVKDRLAGAFDNVEFDIAEQAANLVSGDSIATAFGKLAKNYTSLLTSISDLNTNLTSQINTKLNKSDVLANYTTTATGKALDASLGPAIREKMDLADTLNTTLSTWKSWTPMIYDQNTQIRSWNDGRYIEIGNLVFAYAFENNPSLANISTELQIRNVPITAVIGGGIFIEKLSGSGGSITVQGGSSEKIYFRPAIISSQLSTPLTPGSVTFWCVGYK